MLQVRKGGAVADRSSPFGAFGTDALDLWWRTLLQNRERLEELARTLHGMSGVEPGPAGVSHEDLAGVVEALTLVEKRLDALDEQVQTLAEGMSQLVRHIEDQSSGNRDGDV